MSRLTLPILLAAIGLTIGLGAAPAQAAGSGYAQVTDNGVGWMLSFGAGAGAVNAVVITRSGNTLTVDDRVAITAGPGCKAVKGDKTKVRCTRADGRFAEIDARLGDRNDSITDKTAQGLYANGGAGNDVLRGGRHWDTLAGGAGNDKLYGGTGRDTLNGGAGADQMYGDDGDDWLNGGSGNDRYYGGAGADLLHAIGASGTDADYYSGGYGRDTVSYGSRNKPVKADADGAKGDDGVAGERDTIAVDVNVIEGGAAGDRLYGTARAEELVGGGGKDVIYGGGGNDLLRGGGNADTLYGGAGDDTVAGDTASSLQVGGADVMYGGPGFDMVSYGDGWSEPVTVDLDAEAGDDGHPGEGDVVATDFEGIIGAGAGSVLTGNAGPNRLVANDGNSTLTGGGGNDVLTGWGDENKLYGGAGNDTLRITAREWDTDPNLLDGGPGDDLCASTQPAYATRIACER